MPAHDPRPILSGPGAGLLWYPAAGPHGMWLGLYERRVLTAFAAGVREDTVVWDVGAHAGLYSLVAARRGARVLAFEPHAGNAAWLERHARLNALAERVRIERYALGAETGSAGFEPEATGMEGRLRAVAATDVAVRRADDLDLPAPGVLKIDVEGAELDVLDGAHETIGRSRPVIFLEVHEPVTLEACLALLPGYEARVLDGTRYLCRHVDGVGPSIT